MKAKSEAQQRLFGMVHAFQKGELDNASQEVKDIAATIKKKDAKAIASTKHKGLPEHKKKKKSLKEAVMEQIIAESVFDTIKNKFNPEMNGFYGRKIHDGEPQSLADVFESDGWKAFKKQPINGYNQVLRAFKRDNSAESNSISVEDLVEDLNIYLNSKGWVVERIQGQNPDEVLLGFKVNGNNTGQPLQEGAQERYALKKIQTKIYRLVNQDFNHLFKDDAWQNVKALRDAIANIEGVDDIEMWAGEYHNYLNGGREGVSPYRDYKTIVHTAYGDLGGYIRCCAAGTVDDPFDRYDIVISLYPVKEEDML